jgi:hypothetical protein
MPDPAPNPELLRSLGRLVRGLSALFWGLPAALIVCVGTATAGGFGRYENALLLITLPLAVTGLLFFGIWQLGDFQRQERPWRNALDCARLFALINLGVSPFLYCWNRVPGEPFFDAMMWLLALSALSFLFTLNLVVLRLGAMLPDETLRLETRHYTALNRNLLLVLVLLSVLYVGLAQLPELPAGFEPVFLWLRRGGFWAGVFLILLPLAMTMALIWKTKEVILDSVFGVK